MSLFTVNVFTAGSDDRRPNWQSDPRRFAFAANDPTSLFNAGWKNVFEFQAYNAPVPGTFQVFVQQAIDPHRFWVERRDGSGEGWTPMFNFYAYDKPMPGTTAYYVMFATGSGANPELGPARFEITANRRAFPGWEHKFTFYAFPAAAVPPAGAPVTLHAFLAGDDYNAPAVGPRRMALGYNAHELAAAGWTREFEFQGLSTPPAVGGAIQLFVNEAVEPHRQVPSRSPLGPPFNTKFTFYAFTNQAPGTSAFWVWTAGDSSPHNPYRAEITAANVPAKPGWNHTDTFYAYPRAVSRSLSTIHVFDAEGLRRFAFGLDGIQLVKQGWRHQFEFDAFNTALPGTFQIFVAEATTHCHRFYADRTPGAAAGWTDLFSFHAYASPVEGTTAYYNMTTGGAAAHDPHRHEITTNPTPQPGWRCAFVFYAYARHPEAPPTNPY